MYSVGSIYIMWYCHANINMWINFSAGIGRTGTFIALDNMVKQAKAEGCVRPLQIVETLRRQRLNMVQTKVCTNYTNYEIMQRSLFWRWITFQAKYSNSFGGNFHDSIYTKCNCATAHYTIGWLYSCGNCMLIGKWLNLDHVPGVSPIVSVTYI